MIFYPPCHAFCPAGIANRVIGPPDPARKYARDLGVRYRPAFQNEKSPRFAAENPCPRNSAFAVSYRVPLMIDLMIRSFPLPLAGGLVRGERSLVRADRGVQVVVGVVGGAASETAVAEQVASGLRAEHAVRDGPQVVLRGDRGGLERARGVEVGEFFGRGGADGDLATLRAFEAEEVRAVQRWGRRR